MSSKQVVSLPNIKFANLALRALQLLVAISLIAVYASVPSASYGGTYHLVRGLGIASASISILVAAAFAMTLLLSGYAWVAKTFLVDVLVVGLYATMFAKLKDASVGEDLMLLSKVFAINIVAMLLWSMSSLMGIACLALDWLRGENVTASYY